MNEFSRFIIIVLDGVGCGSQPDYSKYHELPTNTLKACYDHATDFSLPNLESAGLGNILFGDKVKSNVFAGKMTEKTAGNDTLAGIWEMLGVHRSRRFRTTTDPLPEEVIEKLQNVIARQIVGNEYISGFKALDKYYNVHEKLKAPILYLGDDGVALFAAHEDVIPHAELNRMGNAIVPILAKEGVSRVITRPFAGKLGNFIRTENRRDFLCDTSILGSPILQAVSDKRISFYTTEHVFTILGGPDGVEYKKGNEHDVERLHTIKENILSRKVSREVQLYVLQDFDMCGHKKDISGLSNCLVTFDRFLPSLVESLQEDDVLVITADHGCDPSSPERGHSREYVPILLFSPRFTKPESIGVRDSFSDLGQSLCHNFQLTSLEHGIPIYEIFQT